MSVGDGVKGSLRPGSKMIAGMTLDVCIDGSSSTGDMHTSMHMNLAATFKGPDGNDYKLAMEFKEKEKSANKQLPAKE
jgi:hypothetical protein